MRSPHAHQGLVTPEAVRLRFVEGGVGSRGAALLLDWTLQLLLLVGLNVAVTLLAEFSSPVPAWVGITVVLVLNLAVMFGYPIAFETLNGGRTPGKIAMGLRVVTVEGAPVRFRHAAVRSALGLIDFLVTLGAGAVITTLLSRRSQRLGDMVAGTVVVRERTGAPAPRAATFGLPPGWESYAQTIDPSGLRRQDYDTLRAFLLRADKLPGGARDRIGRRLADAVADRIRHRVPDGIAAETFLRCVAARYQRRGAGYAPAAAATPPAAPGEPSEPPDLPTPPASGGFRPPD